MNILDKGICMKELIKYPDVQHYNDFIAKYSLKEELKMLPVRLFNLRKELKINQNEMNSFNQASVSKIEQREDIKLSTLIDYLDDLGYGLEVRAYSKNNMGSEKLLLYV